LPTSQSNITRICQEFHSVCNGGLVGHADFLRKVLRPTRYALARMQAAGRRRSVRSESSMDRILVKVAPFLRRIRCLVATLALLTLSGCVVTGTENPLPASTRVQMPDLRGVWLLQIPHDTKPHRRSEPLVLVLDGQPHDERGCMTVRVAIFDGNGKSAGSWESRDPYEADWTWCAHHIAGLTIVEQRATEDDSGPWEHSTLRQHRSHVHFCDIHEVLWDATPESARREDDDEEIITLSSDALAALIAEHAADLERYAVRMCDLKISGLIPRVPE